MSLPASSARFARALLVVAALGLGALAATPASASAEQVSFGSGHLEWGVMDRFRDYVEGPIGHGSYTATDGATRMGDGRIDFPVLGGTYDTTTAVGELTVGGGVRFVAHGGTLDLTLSHICVSLTGGSGTLYANFTNKDRATGGQEGHYGVPLGALGSVPVPTVVGGTWTWGSIPGTLTEEGVPAFDAYSAGEPLSALQPLVANEGVPQPRPDGSGCRGTAPPGGGGGGGGAGGGGEDGPAGPAGTVRAASKKAILVRGRVVRLATLRCGSAACTVKAPRTVKLKIKSKGGKRKAYRVKVLAPKRLAPGAAGKLRVKLTKAARRALAGRRTTAKVRVTIAAAGKTTTQTVRATLKAKRSPAKRRG